MVLTVFVVFTPYFNTKTVFLPNGLQMRGLPWCSTIGLFLPDFGFSLFHFFHFFLSCLDMGVLIPVDSWGCVPTAFPSSLSQQCIFAAKEAYDLLGSIMKSTASKSREMIFPLYLALLRHIWNTRSSYGLPRTREVWAFCSESSEGQHMLRDWWTFPW